MFNFPSMKSLQVGSTLIDIKSGAVMSANSASTAEVKVNKPAHVTSVAASVTTVSTGAGNVIPFKLADIGEGIAEVELMRWFVKVSKYKTCSLFYFWLSHSIISNNTSIYIFENITIRKEM